MLFERSIQKKNQQGAALIAVLIVIIVITLLGISAMRMGLTGLTIATNSQISNLLFQAADKGMTDMEKAITRNGTTATDISVAMDTTGILAKGNGGDIAYCITPRTGVTWGSGTAAVQGVTAGACDTTSATTEYLSARNVSMTQVNVQRRPINEYDSNSAMERLQMNSGAGGVEPEKLIITSTAVLPNAGGASAATVNACLSGTAASMTSGMVSDDSVDASVPTITDCLTDSGAIFTTHQNEYRIGFNFAQ